MTVAMMSPCDSWQRHYTSTDICRTSEATLDLLLEDRAISKLLDNDHGTV